MLERLRSEVGWVSLGWVSIGGGFVTPPRMLLWVGVHRSSPDAALGWGSSLFAMGSSLLAVGGSLHLTAIKRNGVWVLGVSLKVEGGGTRGVGVLSF